MSAKSTPSRSARAEIWSPPAVGHGYDQRILQEQIYLFDRQTGEMVRRLEGLPNVVHRLTFSPDGRYLAATLGSDGMRIYDPEEDWLEVFRDTDYGGPRYGAVFAADGRLATTSDDGSVRLYDYDAGYRLKASVQVPGARRMA
jgi:WD40 repeat protein